MDEEVRPDCACQDAEGDSRVPGWRPRRFRASNRGIEHGESPSSTQSGIARRVGNGLRRRPPRFHISLRPPSPTKKQRHHLSAGATSSRFPAPAPPTPPPPPQPHAFLLSLERFLFHLSPSLPAHAPTFLAAGLDRVERLTTLLVLSDGSIQALVKEMEARLGVGVDQKRLPPFMVIAFRLGVERAKKGFDRRGRQGRPG